MSEGGYDAFARELLAGGLIGDPWQDGKPRFSQVPEVVPQALWKQLARAAEQLAEVYDEVGRLVEDAPELLDTFFGLTPVQKIMWQASRPLWHGLGRADLFVTDEGLATTELNCDTPTGEAEAVELGRIVAPQHPGLLDPCAGLQAKFMAMVEAMAAQCVRGERPRTAGLLYATEFTEDLSLVRLYRRWLAEAGYQVVLGSPYNLGRDASGRATLFDRPLSVLLRHYKTDWWSERLSAWLDDPIPDAAPLVEPLNVALSAFVEGQTAVINPFGAVLPQNKRAMAFMWEHLHRFSPGSQAVIERLVPFTSRLEAMHSAQLGQKDEWVLKSDYGAEGDEVVLGKLCTPAEWALSLQQARPGRWVAQRYFQAKEREGGEVANYGVFLVAGEAAGLYVRVQAGPTDASARSVPALIAP